MAQRKTAKTKSKTSPRKKTTSVKTNPVMLDVFCAIALMLALFIGMDIHSYGTGENSTQFFGLFGEITRRVVMALFGKTAMLVPVFFVIWAVHLVWVKKMWSARMNGVVLLIVSCTVYYSLEKIPRGLTPWEAAGYDMGGGYIGAVLAILLLKFVGQIGGLIVWAITLFLGCALVIQRSAGSLLQGIIGAVRRAIAWVSQFVFYEEEEDEEEPGALPVEAEADTWSRKEKKVSRAKKEEAAVFAEEPSFALYPSEAEKKEELPSEAEEKNGPVLYGMESDEAWWHVNPEKPATEEPHTGGLVLGDAEPQASDALRPAEIEGALQTETEEEATGVKPSLEETEEGAEEPLPYQKPSLTLLNHDMKTKNVDRNSIRENSRILEQSLADFGVKVKVEEVTCGPAVTRYEMSLAPGTKVSKIVGLSDDLQLRLAAAGIRIEAPIPGKSAVGIEIPNRDIRSVGLYEILASENFQRMNSPLAFALGEDITGRAICARLKDMPHLLIAGSTGSGKSVCLNGIIMSLLFNADPEEVKLVLVDPKMVELTVYNNLPHLMTPVVTDPKKASQILKWMTVEMEKRYKKFAAAGVRDINRYREVTGEPMPYIVIVIDELADLMMVAPGEVEDSICRLAQMARAAGMHLIVATQRPSVDVVTGIIKANIPSRIAFAVSSQMDSRTILDMGGAEKLLGKGDMLFFPVGASKPQRVQGAFVSDEEIEKTVSFITQYNQNKVQYNEELEHLPALESEKSSAGGNPMEEELFLEAVQLFVEAKRASASLLQRRLHIGFVRATDLMELMEKRGIISPVDEKNPRNSRKVLVGEDFLEQLQERYE